MNADCWRPFIILFIMTTSNALLSARTYLSENKPAKQKYLSAEKYLSPSRWCTAAAAGALSTRRRVPHCAASMSHYFSRPMSLWLSLDSHLILQNNQFSINICFQIMKVFPLSLRKFCYILLLQPALHCRLSAPLTVSFYLKIFRVWPRNISISYHTSTLFEHICTLHSK